MYLGPPVGDPTLESGPGLRDNGDVLWFRGEWMVVRAAVVAPVLVVVEVVIVRGFEGEVVWDCGCWDEGEDVAFPCWIAECARKAARKLDRKGRFVGMSSEYRDTFFLDRMGRATCGSLQRESLDSRRWWRFGDLDGE